MNLRPKLGFDWDKVGWGKPDSPRSDFCSYCFDTIPEDTVPLILCASDGRAAQFCDKCLRKWWGTDG